MSGNVICRAAAIRALELDSLLGEAHIPLAYVDLVFGWDFNAAERGFRRGLGLSPSYGRGYLS